MNLRKCPAAVEAYIERTRSVGDALGKLLVEVKAVLQEEFRGGRVDGVGPLREQPNVEHFGSH